MDRRTIPCETIGTDEHQMGVPIMADLKHIRTPWRGQIADKSSALAYEKIAFTVAEACAATGIGKTSLYHLIGEGKLKAFKAAGRRLILRADLEAYLASCRETA